MKLRSRGIIESVNDQLKNLCQIEHTRHRSIANFMVNLVAGMIAYTYQPKKPSLHKMEQPVYYFVSETLKLYRTHVVPGLNISVIREPNLPRPIFNDPMTPQKAANYK